MLVPGSFGKLPPLMSRLGKYATMFLSGRLKTSVRFNNRTIASVKALPLSAFFEKKDSKEKKKEEKANSEKSDDEDNEVLISILVNVC